MPTPSTPAEIPPLAVDIETALSAAQDYTALEERVIALNRGMPLRHAGTTTGRMSSAPAWPFDNLTRGPGQLIRGRTADTVILDDLSDMRTVHEDFVHAAAYAAASALVPVSPPREGTVDRFPAAVLDQIDRPVHEALLAERRRMRTQWEELMVNKAERLYRLAQIPKYPTPINEKRWRTLPEHPLMAETDRRLDMLIEDGVPYEDVRLFSLGHHLNVSTLPFVEHILVCYGLGSQEHFLVKATTINT